MGVSGCRLLIRKWDFKIFIKLFFVLLNWRWVVFCVVSYDFILGWIVVMFFVVVLSFELKLSNCWLSIFFFLDLFLMSEFNFEILFCRSFIEFVFWVIWSLLSCWSLWSVGLFRVDFLGFVIVDKIVWKVFKLICVLFSLVCEFFSCDIVFFSFILIFVWIFFFFFNLLISCCCVFCNWVNLFYCDWLLCLIDLSLFKVVWYVVVWVEILRSDLSCFCLWCVLFLVCLFDLSLLCVVVSFVFVFFNVCLILDNFDFSIVIFCFNLDIFFDKFIFNWVRLLSVFVKVLICFLKMVVVLMSIILLLVIFIVFLIVVNVFLLSFFLWVIDLSCVWDCFRMLVLLFNFVCNNLSLRVMFECCLVNLFFFWENMLEIVFVFWIFLRWNCRFLLSCFNLCWILFNGDCLFWLVVKNEGKLKECW